MVDTTNKDLIRTAVAEFNAGDVNSYISHFVPSCQRWVAGFNQPLSRTEVGENLRLLVEAFDPLQLGEELLMGDDTHLCARWQLRGIQVREFMGFEARSGHINVATCEIYQITNELVIAPWVYQDPGQMFVQMAAGPPEH